MGASTAKTHGKSGALYALRPNGFSGAGLNDVTWGLAATNAATAYYEVVIDGAGVPDTFKWRKNGGGWTSTVAITGAAQTLDEAQQITFGATTGHTVTDQWIIGNLKTEATTVSLATAQITTAGNRLLNPNRPPIWTPTNAVQLRATNLTIGQATFSAAPGVTTATGNNGYLPAAALRKVAYVLDWSLNLTLDMADASYMGLQWKTALPGEAGGSGSFNAYFIATEPLWNNLAKSIAGGEKYFLLQLFTSDPSANQTGDHFNAWAAFTGWTLDPTIATVVKEAVTFQIEGEVAFVGAP